MPAISLLRESGPTRPTCCGRSPQRRANGSWKPAVMPSALLVANSAGIARREALRMWVACHVAPLGRIVAAELSDKLNLPGLTLDFAPLAGSDLVARAVIRKAHG